MDKPLPQAANRQRVRDRIVLAALLAIAFALRFYRLEFPSMWWDEILTAMMAEFPLAYIAKWSLVHECHPPYFYALIKLVLLAGESDFALRLLAATAGTASVLALYAAVSRLFSGRAALFAAAMLAVTPLHVRLSQEVRPYALLLLLGTASLYLFLRLIRDPDRGTALWLAAANAGLLLLHFLSVPFVFAELALLPLLRLTRLSRIRVRAMLGLYGLHALAFLPALPFFFANFYHRPDMIGATGSGHVLFKIGRALAAMVLTFYSRWPIDTAEPSALPVPLIQAGAALLLAGAGIYALLRADRTLAAGVLGVLLVPLACVAAGGQGFFLPRHMVLLLPPLLLLLGLGAARLAPSDGLARLGALLLAATAAFWIVRGHPEDFYAATSHRGAYKNEARALVAALRPGEIVLDGDGIYALNWYVRRFAAASPLTEQRLTPGDTRAVIRVLGENLGHLAKNEDELVARFGRPVARETAYDLPVLTFSLPRSPETAVARLPFFTVADSAPERFYARTAALGNVRIHPYWGGLAIPTKNGAPCFFEYRFDNRAGDRPQRIDLVVKYVAKGPGNSVAVRYAFDDEPEVAGFASQAPAAPGTALVRIDRQRPYRRLTVRLVLSCGLETPDYPGGNLANVGVSEVQASFCPADDDAPCQTASMLRNLPQGFLDAPLAGQTLEETENVASAPGEGGLRTLSPADPGSPAVVRARAAGGAKNPIIYPRVCGAGASVAVYDGEAAKGDPLFVLREPSGACTPVALQVPLSGLSEPPSLTFVLSGKNAQLWAKGNDVLFRPR